jgi:hypothetical protein
MHVCWGEDHKIIWQGVTSSSGYVAKAASARRCGNKVRGGGGPCRERSPNFTTGRNPHKTLKLTPTSEIYPSNKATPFLWKSCGHPLREMFVISMKETSVKLFPVVSLYITMYSIFLALRCN